MIRDDGRWSRRWVGLALAAAVLVGGGSPAQAAGQAPGAPGVRTAWPNADKDGFGTALGGSPCGSRTSGAA